MSVRTNRMPLYEAIPIADDLESRIAPFCERIAVAGSIRRQAHDIGDIQLLAISQTHEVPVQTVGMFDNPTTETILDLVEGVAALRAAGVLSDVEQHKANGQRYIKSVHVESGLQLDLFMVRPPDTSWGVLFLIRTGPADYSHWFVSEARRRGFHVGSGSLHRGGLGCGAIPCEVVPTPEEADVYAALGLPFVPPEARS